MTWADAGPPLAGGALIGMAAAGLLLLTGKTAGVSGILEGVLRRERGEFGWKLAFVLGLVAGGLALRLLAPATLPAAAPRSWPVLLIGALVAGFGARLGGGCTSGHGVCGIGRGSRRGLVGTVVFIAAGMIAVAAMRALGLT